MSSHSKLGRSAAGAAAAASCTLRELPALLRAPRGFARPNPADFFGGMGPQAAYRLVWGRYVSAVMGGGEFGVSGVLGLIARSKCLSPASSIELAITDKIAAHPRYVAAGLAWGRRY